MCELNSRTSVFAVANPKKGPFDVHADLTTNTGIDPPLLSRFDLIFVLLDTPSKEWDVSVSTFLLRERLKRNKNIVSNNSISTKSSRSMQEEDGDVLSLFFTNSSTSLHQGSLHDQELESLSKWKEWMVNDEMNSVSTSSSGNKKEQEEEEQERIRVENEEKFMDLVLNESTPYQVSLNDLQEYICIVRNNLSPKLSPISETLIQRYYMVTI